MITNMIIFVLAFILGYVVCWCSALYKAFKKGGTVVKDFAQKVGLEF